LNSGVSSAGQARTRVLVAHDDASLRLPLTETLSANGYEVAELRRGAVLVDHVRSAPFDLVLLEIRMPGLRDGIESCRLVREMSPRSGIIVVTHAESGEGDGENKVRGLEAGADDYVTAPFELREFHARLRAVLRRVRLAGPFSRYVKIGELEINLDGRTVHHGGRSIHLTRREFDLLALMMQRPGTALPHAQLLRLTWRPDYRDQLEYLRAYIRLLRKKIEADPSKPAYILTEPGIGYRFRDPLDQGF